MASLPGLAPWLHLTWEKFNEQELALSARNLSIDVVVAPLFLAWYLALARLSFKSQNAGLFAAVSRSAARGRINTLVHLVLAAIATYVLCLHIFAAPPARQHQDDFKAQHAMGKWILLTRHGLTLQAWHQVTSLCSLASPKLRGYVHSCSVVVGTLATFVTIQFFMLVFPNPGYQEQVASWKREGVQYGVLQNLLHIPALLIALVDLLFTKDLSLLRAALSLRATVLILAAYIIIYLTLIMVNYQATNAWPYKFMKTYGTNVFKWAIFICAQTCMLYIFAFSLWMAIKLRGKFAENPEADESSHRPTKSEPRGLVSLCVELS